jgi:hypothetical protein
MFLSQVPTISGLKSRPSPISTSAARVQRAARLAGPGTRVAATSFLESGAELPSATMSMWSSRPPATRAPGSPMPARPSPPKHVVMVNVEADALIGPTLAAEAEAAGVVYSMAYGDQPALVAEMVDWARATGFHVVAAGKGTKYLPAYHNVTPDHVWDHYGLTPEAAAEAGMNPQMFNSFLDGTKSAIEMVAIANACGLDVPTRRTGLSTLWGRRSGTYLAASSVGGRLERVRHGRSHLVA